MWFLEKHSQAHHVASVGARSLNYQWQSFAQKQLRYRAMASTATTKDVRNSLLKLAERFDAMADRREIRRAGVLTWISQTREVHRG